MDQEFPAPRPLTTEERQFVVTVEESMRPAFIAAVADEFGPYGRPAAEIAERMSAAAPGQRLQTAVEARMNSGRHFDRFPAEERSAAAQQAVLAAAKSIDSQLTVETSDSRLGELVGKGLDRMFRRQYAEVAHSAAGEAGLVLGGVLATAHLR
ncbi:MAG: hypothetical protein HOU81_04780 [Hamadaea sp.]|nr:hypothetical protein [Hamadaea sp.]